MTKLAYNIPELTAASGVGRTKIYEEIKSGRLKATKAGGRTIILAEDARAWLAGKTARKTEAA